MTWIWGRNSQMQEENHVRGGSASTALWLAHYPVKQKSVRESVKLNLHNFSVIQWWTVTKYLRFLSICTLFIFFGRLLLHYIPKYNIILFILLHFAKTCRSLLFLNRHLLWDVLAVSDSWIGPQIALIDWFMYWIDLTASVLKSTQWFKRSSQTSLQVTIYRI